jgi:Ca-activated chloride channel family protein
VWNLFNSRILPCETKIHAGMKQTIGIVLLALMALANATEAQTRLVTGKVTMADDGSPVPGVNVLQKGTTIGSVTDGAGQYRITVSGKNAVLVFSFIGLQTKEVPVGLSNVINVTLEHDVSELQEVVVTGVHLRESKRALGAVSAPGARHIKSGMADQYPQQPVFNTEEYDGIEENIFREATRQPLSTFSIDVDAASYSNVRRFINNGQRPPKDAVRIEELINYFDYDYPQPRSEHPFSIVTEMAPAPWNPRHQLVHIGLQGRIIATENLPASNLVFLIDVSGSMGDVNKLPLLKASFKLLVEQLREQDKVAIVVYAGAAGLVLPPTSGAEKRKILEALNNLEAGGSTAGGEGLRLAYAVAKENFHPKGNNRVILATDGDFNVGESSNAAMERLVEEKREDGIFLTVLGFGMGNYKDSKMETLANKGNGNYAYIDTMMEARKVLVNEFGGTLFTIAKDVKLQIEFNPAKVKAYRLIGYENRLLRDEDFNNDKKDAGDLGSGHTVTALYEIIPVGVESQYLPVDQLKYQSTTINPAATRTQEWMTVKFRYKEPAGSTSKLIVQTLSAGNDEKTLSDNFKWSAAVAAFGMLLRDSEYANGYTFDDVVQLAQQSRGRDEQGYRIEFINMVRSFGMLASR